MRGALLATAALAAAVAVFTALSLPPRRIDLPAVQSGLVTGLVHVHTDRSDGRSSPEIVAAAAARAGLQFLVFTDHGDGTEAPDPPTYRAGVLCLDGVEISTSGGHYLAFDMPAAPYPLGGEPRDVVEDVHRLGGFGVIAHPDSPREELRWRDWSLPFDGVEIVNPDTTWRVQLDRRGWRPKFQLLQALLTYPFRAPETIASLLATTSDTVDRFGAFAEQRRVVGLSGADAHARLALGDADPGDGSFALPFPGYETVFKALAIAVRTDRPLSGDAQTDAELVIDAIRGGRLHTVVSGVASPSFFDFTAQNSQGTGQEGGAIASDGPLTLRVRSNAPPGFTTTIRQGNRPLASTGGPDLVVVAPAGSGTYRADIRATDRPAATPWIISNPIYVGRVNAIAPAPQQPRATTVATPLFDGQGASGWRIEADPASRAAMDVVALEQGPALQLQYALSDGPPAAQFAALTVETRDGVSPYDRLVLTARAERPMRVSIQARVATSPSTNEHWQRSVYLDEKERELTVEFGDMTPIGAARTQTPPLDRVHSIVFVVELTHARPGSSGRLWIRDASLRR